VLKKSVRVFPICEAIHLEEILTRREVERSWKNEGETREIDIGKIMRLL
jgi:hypothetical protein